MTDLETAKEKALIDLSDRQAQLYTRQKKEDGSGTLYVRIFKREKDTKELLLQKNKLIKEAIRINTYVHTYYLHHMNT
jgi:hypothetical protein